MVVQSKSALNFIKKYEKTIRPETPSYFSVRQFGYSNANNDIREVLQEFMKSKYFLWQEEFRNNVQVNINGKETHEDWNFHGLYDIKQLSPSDFEKVKFENFKARFIAFIETEIGKDNKLPEIQQVVASLYNQESSFYIIRNLPENKVHKWTVYEFFISGFEINMDNKTITLVEFGRD